MRNLTTLILGGASLLLAIVISAVDRDSAGGGASRSYLVRFQDKNIQTITLVRGGQTVVIKQIEGYWFFASPEQERINSNTMAALLDRLNHLAILDRLGKSELVNEMAPENLGLEGEEALQIVLDIAESGKTRTEKLVIGRAAPRENSVYASAVKGKKSGGVVVVNGDPHDILDSPYETLMDRRLIGIPPRGLVQLAVKTAKTGVGVQRNITTGIETPWTIVQPISARADQEKIEDLVASIFSLQITEVDSYDSSPIQIPNPIPEGAALIQFGVYGSEKPITLYLAKDKEQTDTFGPPLLTARISDRPATYRLNSMILDSLEVTAGSLRDRRLGKVPEEALESIAIVQETPRVEVFLKANRNAQGVNWVLTLLNGQEIDANNARINELIDKMNEPVIINFVEGKLSEYGIKKDTALRLYFNFKIPGEVKEDGSRGEAQDFTRLLRLGKVDGRLYANFNADSQIFELDPAFSSLLPTHPIKWRSLNVLSFNSLRLKKIRKEVRGQAALNLSYDITLDQWTATRSDGSNVSNQLDKAMADRLRDRLSSLKAIGWNVNVGEAYKLLETPDAVFTITTSELDRALNDSGEVTRVLKLVESKGIVYGRIDDSPDLFFLDREKFKALIQPLTGF